VIGSGDGVFTHTYTMDLWNRCSEPECVFLTEEEEGQLCYGHGMALNWNKCSAPDCNFLTDTEEGQFCIVHRPEQVEHTIGNTQHKQKDEFIVKCGNCNFKTKGSKRGRLMKRLEKHQEGCKAAMDTVTKQEFIDVATFKLAVTQKLIESERVQLVSNIAASQLPVTSREGAGRLAQVALLPPPLVEGGEQDKQSYQVCLHILPVPGQTSDTPVV
jgi:hypothetical protein